MAIVLTQQFKKDIQKPKKEDKKLLSKVMELITDIDDNIDAPLNGIGKPEMLKNDLSGCYSRRVNQEHRLIYSIKEGDVICLSCYCHYGDK